MALPGALAGELPVAGFGWVWQWVIPASSRYLDAETGERRRIGAPEGCWRDSSGGGTIGCPHSGDVSGSRVTLRRARGGGVTRVCVNTVGWCRTSEEG